MLCERGRHRVRGELLARALVGAGRRGVPSASSGQAFDCVSASLSEAVTSLRMTGPVESFQDRVPFCGAGFSRRAISARRVAASSCREDFRDA